MDISQVRSPYSKRANVVGSCNGILCVSLKDSIGLWNPSIGRQLLVPNCPRLCSSLVVRGGLRGFGFDPISDDYKIVSITYFHNEENRGNIESSFVYSLKVRVIASPLPLFSSVDSVACFVNGVLHWVVRCYIESDDVDPFCILTFDLSTHEFGTIALPQPSYCRPLVTMIQGSLGLIFKHDDDNSWIWAKRDASWSLVDKFQVPGHIHGVLQLSNNGDMLLLCSWRGVYNPKTGVRSRLVDFNAFSYILQTEMFVESLYLLDMEYACKCNQLSPLGGKK